MTAPRRLGKCWALSVACEAGGSRLYVANAYCSTRFPSGTKRKTYFPALSVAKSSYGPLLPGSLPPTTPR